MMVQIDCLYSPAPEQRIQTWIAYKTANTQYEPYRISACDPTPNLNNIIEPR